MFKRGERKVVEDALRLAKMHDSTELKYEFRNGTLKQVTVYFRVKDLEMRELLLNKLLPEIHGGLQKHMANGTIWYDGKRIVNGIPIAITTWHHQACKLIGYREEVIPAEEEYVQQIPIYDCGESK